MPDAEASQSVDSKKLTAGARLRYLGKARKVVVLRERKSDDTGWWLEFNDGGLADFVIETGGQWEVLLDPDATPLGLNDGDLLGFCVGRWDEGRNRWSLNWDNTVYGTRDEARVALQKCSGYGHFCHIFRLTKEPTYD